MHVCSNNRGIENIEAFHTILILPSDSYVSSMGMRVWIHWFFYVKNSGHLGHHVDSPDPRLQDGLSDPRFTLDKWTAVEPVFFHRVWKGKLGGGNSNIFHVHPYLGKIPILTNIFQGWNHQPGKSSEPNLHDFWFQANFPGVLWISLCYSFLGRVVVSSHEQLSKKVEKKKHREKTQWNKLISPEGLVNWCFFKFQASDTHLAILRVCDPFWDGEWKRDPFQWRMLESPGNFAISSPPKKQPLWWKKIGSFIRNELLKLEEGA